MANDYSGNGEHLDVRYIAANVETLIFKFKSALRSGELVKADKYKMALSRISELTDTER